jgi:hypothetical protein
MAKTGLHCSKVQAVLQSKGAFNGWSLCIGAGASSQMFPTWPELVEALISRDPAVGDPKATAKDLLRMFGPDALIAAAQRRLGLEDEQFSELLTEILFSTLQTKLDNDSYASVVRALKADQPNYAKLADWKTLLKVTSTTFGYITSVALAYLLADIIETPSGPRAIYSFNAETLLYSLVTAVYATTRVPADQAARGQMAARRPLDLVTGAFANPRAPKNTVFFLSWSLAPSWRGDVLRCP